MSLSQHELEAVLTVARLVGPVGCPADTLLQGIALAITHGEFSRAALNHALEVLYGRELLLATDSSIKPSEGLLAIICTRSTAESISLLASFLAGADAQLFRVQIGERGEKAVVHALQVELRQLGQESLVNQVLRMSLVSDSLGYDVRAPSVRSGYRLIEVKATVGHSPTRDFRFFLSRNQYEVGINSPRDWALVTCRFLKPDSNEAEISWCRAQTIKPFLPEDLRGRWVEALVRIPQEMLFEGIPPYL